MNSLNFVIKHFRLRQTLIAVFVGITLFLSTNLVKMQAIASPIPALATYQIDDTETVRTNKTLPSQYIDEDLAANAQKNLKKNTNAVKDKLNFDNPTSADTKAQYFMKNTKERAEKAGRTAQRSFDNFAQINR